MLLWSFDSDSDISDVDCRRLGLQDGDLVLIFYRRSDNGAITAPAGWTVHYNDTAATVGSACCVSKVWNLGDDFSAISFTTGSARMYCSMALRGIGSLTIAGSGAKGSGTTIATPGWAGSSARDHLIAICVNEAGGFGHNPVPPESVYPRATFLSPSWQELVLRQNSARMHLWQMHGNGWTSDPDANWAVSSTVWHVVSLYVTDGDNSTPLPCAKKGYDDAAVFSVLAKGDGDFRAAPSYGGGISLV